MSVALPELPDDRRAQHPRHGRSDEPSGAHRHRAPVQPGIPERGIAVPHLPATPWPIGGLPADPRQGWSNGSNGHSSDGHTAGGHTSNGHTANGHSSKGYSANGYGGPRHGGPAAPLNGRVGADGGGPVNDGAAPYAVGDGYVNGRHDGSRSRPDGEWDAPEGFDAPQLGSLGRGAPDRRDAWDGRSTPGGPAPANGGPASGGTGAFPGGATGFPGGVPINVRPAPTGPWTEEPEDSRAQSELPGDPADGGPAVYRPAGPGDSGRYARPTGESPSGSQPPRRIRSDVPPPRHSPRPVNAPGRPLNPPPTETPQAFRQGAPSRDSGPPGGWNGGAGNVDQPTVINQRPAAGDASDEEIPGFPGRHRRRAGESPDERPASSYREQATAATGKKGRGGRRRRSAFWKELPILIVVALLLTFLIQTFIAKVYVIPSGSMETTLHGCTGCNNDRVLVDKVSYRFSDPQPGDVVVFRGPDGWTSEFTADQPSNIAVRALQGLGSLIGLAPPDEKDFIKRVIAVGGQTVQCCDSRNRVLVDGKPLDEPYIYFLPDAGAARQDTFGPVTVPAGELWMMGDSRNNSADSRVPGHGPVPISNVIGRARLIVLPFARFGSIPSPNPQTTTTAVGLGAGDAGAPVALGMVGLLPLIVLRRRERELGHFLPRRRT